MGKGLALQFKNQYPKMFEEYRKYCKAGNFKPGDVWYWRAFDTTLWDIEEHTPKYICCFSTKNSWRYPSKLEWIESGLQRLYQTLNYKYKHNYIKSVAIPKLGCNNGGLDWEDVKPLINEYLSPLSDKGCWIEVYENELTNNDFLI